MGKGNGSDVDFKGKEAGISSLNEGVYGEDSHKENQSSVKNKEQVKTHRTDKNIDIYLVERIPNSVLVYARYVWNPSSYNSDTDNTYDLEKQDHILSTYRQH